MMAIVTAGTAVALSDDLPAISSSKPDLIAASIDQGTVDVSRSADRAPLLNEAAADELVKGHRYAQQVLEVHAAAGEKSPVLAKLGVGDKVRVTGVTDGDWAQVIHKDLPRWVLAKGIAKDMPLGTAPCASGSGVESGLQPDTVKVHRAACALFPTIRSYGGRAGRGEHASGRAIDIMVGQDAGPELAAFMRANAAKLGISQVIYSRQIWTVQRSGDGWRGMSDRGGATANHEDHVHVTTYGNAAQ